MKICGIYMISIRADNGRTYYYVGQSSNINKRRQTHLSFLNNNSHANKKLQSCFNKYKNFKFEILHESEISSISSEEQWWINEMHGNKYCLNLAKDAEVATRGLIPSEESKEKSRKTRSNWSVEKREALSAHMSSLMKGRVFSEESKRKMSEATRGSGNSQFGKTHSEEHRKKQSDSMKLHLAERRASGNPRPGRKWTKEQIEKRTITARENRRKKKELHEKN